MRHVFDSPHLKKKKQREAVFYEYYDKARFCLITGMDPFYYDTMTVVELEAWTIAWNEINKEKGGK